MTTRSMYAKQHKTETISKTKARNAAIAAKSAALQKIPRRSLTSSSPGR